LLAKVLSAALVGVDAVPVAVEVSLERGLPCFLVVGLPDAAVRESRDRVAAAFRHARLEFPAARVTVNLAPADLRKEGTWYDLAIAVGLLAATRQIPERHLAGRVVLGELSLDGGVRPVRGVLAVALEAARLGWQGLVVPRENAAEAGAAGALDVVAVASLAETIAWARGQALPEAATPPAAAAPFAPSPDPLAGIRGQATAKRALEIAAAGGHGILFVGPPGTGKTLLARALPDLLPPLGRSEALEVSRIHSVAGALAPGQALLERPPFRAPHMSASAAGILGGGFPFRPGELSLAHHGVLFLDELPEFSRSVLEALRQPLESGEVVLVRARGSVRLPARVQLVAAMNPCPCGFLGHPRRACRCAPSVIARYRGRISGPLLERIDLVVEVPVETKEAARLWREPATDERSDGARDRVLAARAFARSATRPATPNARLSAADLPRAAALAPDADRLLADAAARWSLSARAVHRTLRVARTIADLGGRTSLMAQDIAESLSLRHETADAAGRSRAV
jgi:magnesium chelatase family protein